MIGHKAPTSPQFSALQRAFACQGECWRNDLPRTVLADCVTMGWLREDRDGLVWLTDSGREAFEAGR